MRTSLRFRFEIRFWLPVGGGLVARTRRVRTLARARGVAERFLARHPLPITGAGYYHRSDVYGADIIDRRTGETTAIEQPEERVMSVGERGVW